VPAADTDGALPSTDCKTKVDGGATLPDSKVISPDTIPPPPGPAGKITQLTIAPLVGEAIRRNHCGESISELFV